MMSIETANCKRAIIIGLAQPVLQPLTSYLLEQISPPWCLKKANTWAAFPGR